MLWDCSKSISFSFWIAFLLALVGSLGLRLSVSERIDYDEMKFLEGWLNKFLTFGGLLFRLGSDWTLSDDAFLVGRLRRKVETADVVGCDVHNVDRFNHVAKLPHGVLGKRWQVQSLEVFQRFEHVGADVLN